MKKTSYDWFKETNLSDVLTTRSWFWTVYNLATKSNQQLNQVLINP